jgi:hypothetical protein
MMAAIQKELDSIKDMAFAESYTDYPEAASENAKIALRYAEENGWGECGTPVGKARANQLANKEAISRDTIARMAGFERHRQNSQKELGDGCGRLMWLAWGGDEGVEWASRKLKQLNTQFAKKRISFDYDDTLTTAKGQDMARRFLAANDEIFIITARTQSNGGPVYAMAEKLGIKKENVYFTAGKHKYMLVNRLRINKHIDNNTEELQLITENTQAEAIKI